MACEYCGEENSSDLVTRSEVVDGKVETATICTSCLWEQLLEDTDKNENLLSKKKTNSRRISPESKSTH